MDKEEKKENKQEEYERLQEEYNLVKSKKNLYINREDILKESNRKNYYISNTIKWFILRIYS